jgi:hypothetical protein
MNLEAPVPGHVKIRPFEPRKELLLSSWLKRDLPQRDYLLGGVICTTSRWLVFGDTGIGKTLLALGIAGAVASGRSFLNWEGSGRRARVMYLDGEMPAETHKERMALIAEDYGNDLPLYGYNREVLPDGAMPPLNTPEGQKWLSKEIEAVRPGLIVFDSIMCLLVGSLGEEESWAPIKPLVRQLSSKRSKSFGTKTREWEMDTVAGLAKANDGSEGIQPEFKKARLRTPENRTQFDAQVILRGPEGWISDGVRAARAACGRSIDVVQVRRAIEQAYDRLSGNVGPSPGFDGKPVRKISVDALRDEVKSRGFLEMKETGGLTNTGRSTFHRAKSDLIAAGTHIEHESQFWKFPPPTAG